MSDNNNTGSDGGITDTVGVDVVVMVVTVTSIIPQLLPVSVILRYWLLLQVTSFTLLLSLVVPVGVDDSNAFPFILIFRSFVGMCQLGLTGNVCLCRMSESIETIKKRAFYFSRQPNSV